MKIELIGLFFSLGLGICLLWFSIVCSRYLYSGVKPPFREYFIWNNLGFKFAKSEFQNEKENL